MDKNGMKSKYQLVRGRNIQLISSIDDIVVRAATKILCSKVLHKKRPTECTTTTIEIAEQCAQGVHINWSQFLMNELMDNVVDVHEHLAMKFHYLWLLILISFATQTPLIDYQTMEIPMDFLGVQFQNLWDHKDNKRKADTKLAFFLQGETLRQIMCNQ